MKLCRHSSGLWIGTQGDAKQYVKDNGGSWEVIDVPTDKDGLLNYLNGLRAETPAVETVTIATADMNPERGGEPSIQHEVPVEAPKPATPSEDELKAKMRKALKSMADDAIEERIMAARGIQAARFLWASLERLGELGREVFPHINSLLDQHPRVNIRDRGLSYLTIAMVERLTPKQPEEQAAT